MKVTLVNGKIKNSPCIEIVSNTYQFIKVFFQPTLNKIIVTRKTIEESGAVDLIDILKSISDVNMN